MSQEESTNLVNETWEQTKATIRSLVKHSLAQSICMEASKETVVAAQEHTCVTETTIEKIHEVSPDVLEVPPPE